jgi:hypothetical protein
VLLLQAGLAYLVRSLSSGLVNSLLLQAELATSCLRMCTAHSNGNSSSLNCSNHSSMPADALQQGHESSIDNML